MRTLAVFSMADNRPKRAKNIPKRFINEISTVRPVENKKPNATDNNLYEVETEEIDNVAKTVKIHFKGFDEKYD